MKIHEELLELSRKADKIIHSSIDFNLGLLKTFKEKALEIMACKTLEDLKKLSKATEPEKKYKKFDIPFEISKVHLHSNKSSFASTSGNSDQNNTDNSSVFETEVRKFLAENHNSNDGILQKEINKRDEVIAKSFNSEATQQNSQTKNSRECNSKNFATNNFHSSLTETSSKSSTSKDIEGIYSKTNFIFEKQRNVDIMEKIEETNEDIVSKKFVTVSTMIKTSYSKSSNEIFEESLRTQRDSYNEKTYSSSDRSKELHHSLPDKNIGDKIEKNDENIISQTITVSTMIKTLYTKSLNENFEEIIQNERAVYYDTDNIESNEVFPNENLYLPPSEVNCNTDFATSSDRGLKKIINDNIMPQSIQFDECNNENKLDTCNLSSVNKVLSEAPFSLAVPCSPQTIVKGLQNRDNKNTEISANFPVPSIILVEGASTDSNLSGILKSRIVSEMNSHVNSKCVKDISETNDKEKKFSRKGNIPEKNFQVVSAIPVIIENKDPDALNSKKLCTDTKIKRKLKENTSLLHKNDRNYNLRSLKNNATLKTNCEIGEKCSKPEFNKSIILKEKVEEKKRLREQKMKLTRQRRENLEKERKERLHLGEERRIKRFEQHKEILKRKIMEVKNKAKCRRLSKQFASSSEASPECNIEPQSLQTGLDRTYLIANLEDVSPIEPTENAQDRSSGEGLNYSLLYNSKYDKKVFMKQSVVLSDIAQLMPPGTIQNCLNLSQNKETNLICNKAPYYTPSHDLRKRKLSAIDMKNSSGAPIKKLMKSTRKISVSLHNIIKDEVRKGGRNSEKIVGISDSGTLKLPPQHNTKAKYNSAKAPKLRSDPKLSMETYVVLEKLSKFKNENSIYSEIKTPNEAEKVKTVTLSSNVNCSDPKLSALSPVVVLKDISNIKSSHSRLTDDKSKTAKVFVCNDGIENDPKLSVLKPGVVLNDLINSKSCIQVAGKKIEKNKKVPNNYKRKAQDRLNENKSRKKPLTTNKASENQNEFSNPKRSQASDITSYEISDISDNSINIIEQKHKKIPTWASNIHLKQAILKQHYAALDADAVFGNFKKQKAIDLAEIFTLDKPQYHNRTSSAKWSEDESPI